MNRADLTPVPALLRRRCAGLLVAALASLVGVSPLHASLDEPAPASAPSVMRAQRGGAPEAQSPERGMDDKTQISLIPRAALFGNPSRIMAQISPTGSAMAFIAPSDGVLNVFVGPLTNPGEARAVTHNTVRGVNNFAWAYTGEHILYADDANGDENFRVYAVNVKTGEKKDLTPLSGVRAEIFKISSKFPSEVVLGLNDRDPKLHDVYWVNLDTGERTLVLKNEQWGEMVVDDDFKVRLGAKTNADGSVTWNWLNDDGTPKGEFVTFSLADTASSRVEGFDASGKILYIVDSTGRNTGAVYQVNADTGEKRLVIRDDKADAGAMLVHPETGIVQAVSFETDRARWTLLSEELSKDFQALRKTNVTGDMIIQSRSLDDRYWVVSFIEDDAPAKTYLYDRGEATKDASGKVTRGAPSTTFLFANRPELENAPLVKMHPVTITARDGLKLVCYYSLPLQRDPDMNGKPDKPAPLVLNVHGGPWARDSWGLRPEHQWLANRGYAVLSVNYRGSEGFGKEFLNAGNKEWAGKMHDDLIDAVDWAVKQGIAEPDKVAIYGGSYGGDASLVGLTFTPDKFACAVDIVGPSNLQSLLTSFPEYWQAFMDNMAARVGDPRTEEGKEFLKSRSPLTFVDRISKPLLIAQGANDPRVKQAESDQIVSAMKTKNLPVTYVLYPDEGHGFRRPENRMSFYAVAEAFLAQHLGGRFEPFGDAFKGSTIDVKEGSDQIPGLSEALANRPKP